jgi:hypothetical protein
MGLPDGIFAYQKYQFGYALVGRGMGNVGIFCGHLVHIPPFWYTYFVVIWHIFHCFGILCQEKSGNPDADATIKCKESLLEKTGYFKPLMSVWHSKFLHPGRKLHTRAGSFVLFCRQPFPLRGVRQTWRRFVLWYEIFCP